MVQTTSAVVFAAIAINAASVLAMPSYESSRLMERDSELSLREITADLERRLDGPYFEDSDGVLENSSSQTHATHSHSATHAPSSSISSSASTHTASVSHSVSASTTPAPTHIDSKHSKRGDAPAMTVTVTATHAPTPTACTKHEGKIVHKIDKLTSKLEKEHNKVKAAFTEYMAFKVTHHNKHKFEATYKSLIRTLKADVDLKRKLLKAEHKMSKYEKHHSHHAAKDIPTSHSKPSTSHTPSGAAHAHPTSSTTSSAGPSMITNAPGSKHASSTATSGSIHTVTVTETSHKKPMCTTSAKDAELKARSFIFAREYAFDDLD